MLNELFDPYLAYPSASSHVPRCATYRPGISGALVGQCTPQLHHRQVHFPGYLVPAGDYAGISLSFFFEQR